MNWREIDRVLAEADLTGSWLQGIRQSDYRHFLLDFYRSGRPVTLLVGLAAPWVRLHPTARRWTALKTPPRFTQLLRSRALGYRVESCAQWHQERLVRLDLAGPEDRLILWIRLWGPHANLLACDPEGRIFDAAFRRPKSGEISGALFAPPDPRPAPEGLGLRDLPGEGTYSQRLEDWYEAQSGGVSVEKLREQARRLLLRRWDQLNLEEEGLQERRRDYERREDWQTYGDLLLAAPDNRRTGLSRWTGKDWRDNSELSLDLDPKLSLIENAQRYYRKAAKARDGQAQLVTEERRWQAESRQVQNRLAELEGEELPGWVAGFVRRAQTKAPAKTGPSLPGLTFFSQGFRLLVGRSAKENEELLRRHVRGSDWWLHTRDRPGAYVFIQAQKGKSVPLEVLLDAGNLALWYSQAKDEGRADLYYTQVKHLRKAKNGPPGLVLPTQEKNLAIVLDPSRLTRLKQDAESETIDP